MKENREKLQSYLEEFDVTGFFVNGLGYNACSLQDLTVEIKGHEYSLKSVANKGTHVVYSCEGQSDKGDIQSPTLGKILKKAEKSTPQCLIIFRYPKSSIDKWRGTEVHPDGSSTLCTFDYFASEKVDKALALLKRIQFPV